MIRVVSSNIKLAGHDFSSTQINLPDPLAKRIIAWGKKRVSPKELYTENGDKGREDEIHVTVKYGLHTNDVNDVKKIILGFGAFKIRLGQVSRFVKNDDFDVLKLEVDGKRLRELNSLVSENLENSDKHPLYQPHVTVAYIQKGSCRDLSGLNDFEGEEIDVDHIWFSPAEGKKVKINLN